MEHFLGPDHVRGTGKLFWAPNFLLMLSCFSPSSYSAVAVAVVDVEVDVDYSQRLMKEISVVAVVIHEEESL